MPRKKKEPEPDQQPQAPEEVMEPKPKSKTKINRIIAAATALVSLIAAGAGTVFAYKKMTAAASEAARKLARERGGDIKTSDVARAAFEQLSGIPLTEIEIERLRRAQAAEEEKEAKAMEFRSKMEQRRLKYAVGALKEAGKERSKRMAKVQAFQEKREQRERREALQTGLEALKEAKEEGGARRLVIEAAAKAGQERMKREWLNIPEGPQPMSGLEERTLASGIFDESEVRTRPAAVRPKAEKAEPTPGRKGYIPTEMVFEPTIPIQTRPRFAESMDTVDYVPVPIDERPVRAQPQTQRSDISAAQPQRMYRGVSRQSEESAAKKRAEENEAKRRQAINVEEFTRRREAREAAKTIATGKRAFAELKRFGEIRGKTKQIIGPRKRDVEPEEDRFVKRIRR